MDLPDEMRIEFSRQRLLLPTAGLLVFAVGSAWILTIDAAEIRKTRGRFNDPLLVRCAGVAGVVAFGGCWLITIRKLVEGRPGLEFTSAGLIDNASGVAAGLIPWSDIRGAHVTRFNSHRFLSIHVVDPERYIMRGSLLRRASNRMNNALSGSAINIASGVLTVSVDELLRLYHVYAAKYGGGAGSAR